MCSLYSPCFDAFSSLQMDCASSDLFIYWEAGWCWQRDSRDENGCGFGRFQKLLFSTAEALSDQKWAILCRFANLIVLVGAQTKHEIYGKNAF